MSMQDLLHEQAAIKYVALFENMTPASIDQFDDIFSIDARFRDPFNDVRGVAAIKRIFEHMYEVCDSPRFVVLSTTTVGNTSWLQWDFCFVFKQRDMTINGASMVRFNEQGKVTEHIDYWDAASELYEHIPVVGWFMRKLHQQMATPMS